MRETWLLLAGVLLLAAGCIGNERSPDPASPASPASGDAGSGSSPEPGPDPAFRDPVNVTKDKPGAEPMLDVAPDGTVYLTGIGFSDPVAGTDGLAAPLVPANGLWRSADGENWSDVSPDLPGGSEGSLDNVLAVGGDGTVYYGTATEGAIQMFRSPDGGETWVPLPAPVPPPEGHRMWLVPNGSSTVHAAVTGLGSNDVWYHRSTDRGTTWPGTELAYEEGGLSTDLAVGPDGTRYLARVDVEGAPITGDAQRTGFTLYRSAGGPVWEAAGGVEFDGAYKTSWSSLEAGPDGTLYLAWGELEGDRGLTHYAYSTDGGDEWSTPEPVAPTNGTQVIPWIDVRGPGELGLVHYAAAEAGAPEDVDGEWYPEYVFVDDADTDQPRTYETRLTDWPVHEGRICTTGSQGPSCGHGASLLDFTWIEFGPEDRAHVAVASSQSEAVTAFPVYAAETEPWPPG